MLHVPNDPPPLSAPFVSRREWRAVILFALAVLLLTTLPYLVGAAAGDPDQRFGWFTFRVEDGNSYLAKMRQGAAGDGLFRLPYTHEPHDGALMFVPYLLLGKVAALLVPPDSPALTDAMLLVYHIARLIFGGLLILVTYRFVAVFLRSRRLRWLALTLICLGGGAGWLLIALGAGYWYGEPPLDINVPEAYTFYLFYGLPHLSLARAGLLGGWLFMFRAARPGPPRRWLLAAGLAGACWLVTALCAPFLVAVIGGVLGAWGLAVWLRTRTFPGALALRAAIAAVPAGVMLLYTLLAVGANPALSAFQAQNLLLSPHPAHLIAGYGLYVILALPALGWAWRRGGRDARFLLLLAWIVAAPLLAYVPVEIQRRLVEGVFVPLCILAAAGMHLGLLRWLQRRAGRWAVSAVALTLVGLAALTPALTLLYSAVNVLVPPTAAPFYHASDELAALDWLNANASPDSVALAADPITANYLPARTALRGYYGHPIETLDVRRKQASARRFFAGEMDAAERCAFLTESRIGHVLDGPIPAPLDAMPELRAAFEAGRYRVFAVAGCE
jgi:hypothetical protein